MAYSKAATCPGWAVESEGLAPSFKALRSGPGLVVMAGARGGMLGMTQQSALSLRVVFGWFGVNVFFRNTWNWMNCSFDWTTPTGGFSESPGKRQFPCGISSMFYSAAPSFDGFNPMPRTNGATQPPAVHGCGLMAMQKTWFWWWIAKVWTLWNDLYRSI